MEITGGSWMWTDREKRLSLCHECSGDGEFSSTGYLDGVLTPCEACNGTGIKIDHSDCDLCNHLKGLRNG